MHINEFEAGVDRGNEIGLFIQHIIIKRIANIGQPLPMTPYQF